MNSMYEHVLHKSVKATALFIDLFEYVMGKTFNIKYCSYQISTKSNQQFHNKFLDKKINKRMEIASIIYRKTLHLQYTPSSL